MRDADEQTGGSSAEDESLDLQGVGGTLDAEVSLFSNVRDKKPSATITMRELLKRIAGDDDWRERVSRVRVLRSEKNEEAYQSSKKNLQAFTFSGWLRTRAAGASAEERDFLHTGWLQGDLDGKDHPNLSLDTMMELLKEDPHVGFAYRSPSGTGMKAGIRIPADASLHGASFRAAAARFAKVGLILDKATKSPVHLCYVSHDPEVWIREGPSRELEVELAPPEQNAAEHPLQSDSEPEDRTPTVHVRFTEDQMREMLSFIPKGPDYEHWLLIASATWHGAGEGQGTLLLKEWSPEKVEGEYERKYPKRLKKITVGTLVHHAREHGWTEGTLPDDICFYSASSIYYLRERDRWIIQRNRGHVIVRLAKSIPGEQAMKEKLARAAVLLQRVEERQNVDWVGKLAGYRPGLHNVGQNRFLITEGPLLIQPAAGLWKTVESLISNILGSDPDVGNQQVPSFLAWLKQGLEVIRSGIRTPGYVLILVGIPQSGKTLLVWMISLIFGGRVGMPHQAWSSGTPFNSDFAGAELLVQDDCNTSSDMVKRRALGASWKESLFDDTVRIHPKGREAFVARPVWRAVMCCNDNPDSLYVIPPLSEDLEDKVMILRCHKRPLPMPASSPMERRRLQEVVQTELPAFIDFLERLELSPEIKSDSRCGFQTFHHPLIKALLADLTPEAQFLGMIEYLFQERDAAADVFDVILPRPPLKKVWTAADLLAFMGGDSALPIHMRRGLPGSPQRAGRYLGSLCRSHPHCIGEATMLNGTQRWEIKFPLPS